MQPVMLSHIISQPFSYWDWRLWTTGPWTGDSGPLDPGLIIGTIVGVIILLLIANIIVITVIIVIKRTKKLETLIVKEHEGVSDITVNSNEAYGFKPSTFSMTQNTPSPTEEGVYEVPDQMEHDYTRS